MTDPVVYTTVFGDTDHLKEPEAIGKARWVCFSDRPIQSARWEVIVVGKTSAPSRACRMYKQRSHVIFPDATWTLWVDSSMRVLADPVSIACAATHDMMTFRHPDRRRISEEWQAIIKWGKAPEQVVIDQLAAYQADGWDTEENPQSHISNGGFIFRRNIPLVNKFNEMWHKEVQTRCLRDQMSIDYCAWKCGLRIGHFAGNVRRNRFVQYRPRSDKRMCD